MLTDAELLHRYVHEQSEEAFTEFVHRNVGLVYSAALRRTGGRAHLAEEIAQKVFSDLSHKAAALSRHPAVAGWLYRSTRYAAIDAVRAERRRQNLAQSLSAMHGESSLPEPPASWDQLQPVLDDAMDALKERDREIMLLRFFKGLTFAEVGEKLHLSENAARKRADRALDKLRTQLGKRGVTSTAAALSLLLTNQSLAAAPASVAAIVAAAALTTTPATGVAGLLTIMMMSKLTAPVCSAVCAAALTTIVWSTAHQDLRPEIARLRQENARLAKATSADSPAAARIAVAHDYARQATAIAQAMGRSPAAPAELTPTPPRSANSAEPALSAHGYSNRGQATALDAVITFAWASDTCDPEIFSKLVYFDAATREHALKVLAIMPAAIRVSYPTPEDFYGLLLAASCVEAPPPDAAIAKHLMTLVEIGPGRVAVRRIGSTQNFHEYQQTSEGWKFVFPDAGIESAPQILNSETLANLSRHP